MRPENAIARLLRAGDRNSGMWKKNDDAVDDLAEWLGSVLPNGDHVNILPLGYTFRFWNKVSYELEKPNSQEPHIILTWDRKSRESILGFCKDVEFGLLTDIEKMFNEESDQLESVVGKLVEFVLKPAGPPPSTAA